MLKLSVIVCILFVSLISQTNAGIVNLAWNTGISGRTTLVFPNDTIIWTITDSNTHTVTSDNATFWDSGFITTNFTLNTVNLSLGSYPYHCNVHSFMTGTIVITLNVSSSDTLSGTLPSPSITKSSPPTISFSSTLSNTDSITKAASSQVVAASSQVVAASSVVGNATSSGSKSKAVVASSNSQSKTVSSTVSGVVAASKSLSSSLSVSNSEIASQAGATPTRTGSISQSSSPSGTPAAASQSTGVSVSKSGAALSSQVATTHSITGSKAGVKSKTLTGLAAITCREGCETSFIACKRTSRRLRPCRRAKKACVASCGIVNPN